MSSKNINTNTNIAQIILSDKHEIRLKKKPKKKSSGAKKKALEDVKEALRNYDMAVAEAKSKNVTLPAELGVLPVKIEDVNSVKELQALAIKLQSMTSQINQLISQGASQQRTIGLFQEGIGSQRQGFLPPVVQPQIIPAQQIVPQEKPIVIRPANPQIIDPSKKPADDPNAEKTLEQIRQEILNKLSPEDKAKAEAEIEKQKEDEAKQKPNEPLEPSSKIPSLKPAEINESDFEENKGIEFGKRRFDLKSPVGFYDLLTRYRRYIKNVIFESTEINTGEYKIEKDKYRNLQDEKENILKDYYVWLSKLNLSQTNFMDSNAELLAINNEMVFDLNENPEDLAQKLLKAQGVNVTEFKVGEQETKSEKILESKLTEKGLAYRGRMNKQIDVINEIIMNANKTVKPDELKDLENQLNLIRSDVGKYNQLDAIDKVGLEVKYAQLQDMLNQAFKEIQDKEQEIAQGLPVSPLEELVPIAPVAKDPFPKDKEGKDIIKPKKDLPKSIDKDALKIVIDYAIKYPSITNYSKSVKTALLKLPDSKDTADVNLQIQQRETFKKDKAKEIRENVIDYLKSQNLIE